MVNPIDFSEIEKLRARQTALEGLVTQVLASLCVKLGPQLSKELIEKIRTEMHVSGGSQDDRSVLLVEEYVAALGDRVERAYGRMKSDEG